MKGSAGDLPPLYARWFRTLLRGEIPLETRATCADCVMCSRNPPPGSPVAEERFHPDTKCCTAQPWLPNFLVGLILSDDDPAGAAGRDSLRKRMAAAETVLPHGLAVPASYTALLRRSGLPLGKDPALLCPHYVRDSGTCGIWKQRAAVCATWFCRFVRGEVGLNFWTAVHALLAAAEVALSRECVLRFNDGAPGFTGRWKGREEEFYQACSAWVARLPWRRVRSLGGPRFASLARDVRRAYRRLLDRRLPPSLRPGPFTIDELPDPSRLRLVNHRLHEPVDLERPLAEALQLFDGRPTPETLRSISARTGLVPDRALLRRLADFGILRDGRDA